MTARHPVLDRAPKPVITSIRPIREGGCDVHRRRLAPLVILLSAPLFPLTAQQPGAPPESRANLYSLDKEMALGRQMASEVRRSTHPIEDARIDEYVSALGRRLAAAMPDARAPFTFTVFADDPCPTTHEPGSLPGGYIFVPAALFAEAQSEAEFAGMLAHSMAHVAAHHATREATQSRPALGTVPLIFIGGWSGNCTEGLPLPSGFQAMHRGYELEADSLAVAAIAQAGFDPAALRTYIQRVQVERPQSRQISTLPAREERVAAMNPIIERSPASSYIESRSEFLDIQQRIRSLVQHPQSMPAPSLRRN